MYWVFSKFAVKNILYIQRTSFIKRNQTHYEVLNLSRTCSLKEIKESYIKLSKKYHPDRNTDKDSKNKFIKVVAAYDVLSRPDSRRHYDLGLIRNINDEPNNAFNVKKDPWSDPLFWNNRYKEKGQHYTYQSYYGIKGVNKVSNLVIVLICFCITTLGVSLQILAIRNSMTLKREDMLKKSSEAEDFLRESKEKASVNGNLQQLEELKKRMGIKSN